MWSNLFSSIVEHFILFIITSSITIIICFGIHKAILQSTERDNKKFSQSKAANLTALAIFLCTIIFYVIYGQIFPFKRGIAIQPYEALLGFVALLSAITIPYFIFFGTAFLKNKISSSLITWIIRIVLTLIYSFLVYGLFYLLVLTSCAFGAGECCC